jgi:hypothetical protein
VRHQLKILIFGLLLFVQASFAQGPNSSNSLFLGVGSADDSNPYESDDTPWALGWVHHSGGSNASWGIDIAGEGTMLDSTYDNVNAIKQAISINLIGATNLSRAPSWRVDLGFLAGFRQTAQECPDSYLGFQCYADEPPDTEYSFNYGGVLFIGYKSLSIGLRATGESNMLTFGLNF